MAVKYIYNPKTHTLHIKGYCHHTAYGYAGYLVFNSEAEALAYDGRAVGMCKLCEKKRTQQMQKERGNEKENTCGFHGGCHVRSSLRLRSRRGHCEHS